VQRRERLGVAPKLIVMEKVQKAHEAEGNCREEGEADEEDG